MKNEKTAEHGTFPSIDVTDSATTLHVAQEIMVDGNCAIAGPWSMADEMHQNPCEDENHIAKLSESAENNKLCDSLNVRMSVSNF